MLAPSLSVNLTDMFYCEQQLQYDYAFMLQECILDHLEICVTEAEKRETGALNIRDFYTVYLIETKLVAYPYF
jgi:hypothetical protein